MVLEIWATPFETHTPGPLWKILEKKVYHRGTFVISDQVYHRGSKYLIHKYRQSYLLGIHTPPVLDDVSYIFRRGVWNLLYDPFPWDLRLYLLSNFNFILESFSIKMLTRKVRQPLAFEHKSFSFTFWFCFLFFFTPWSLNHLIYQQTVGYYIISRIISIVNLQFCLWQLTWSMHIFLVYSTCKYLNI